MTEEVKEQPKIFTPDEIHEMFDTAFLPKLKEFAERSKKEMYPDQEVACFQARLFLEFSDLEAPLTYESLKGKVELQLSPVLQEDIDKAKAKQAEEDGKDTGDE